MNIKVFILTIGLLSICSLLTYTIQYLYNVVWFKVFGICGIVLYTLFIILSFIVFPCIDKTKTSRGIKI
jgi:hypothetical protein